MATPERYERINGAGWYFRHCLDCGVEIRDRCKDMSIRCRQCDNDLRFNASCDWIVACIQAWADRYGEPPTAIDWNPQMAMERGETERARRYYDGAWPSTSSAQNTFGSWSNALEAAGFPRREAGTGRRYVGDDPQIKQQAVELYVSGLSCRLVAQRLGCDPNSVRRWVNAAGVVRSLSEAQKLRLLRVEAA